MLAHKDVRTQIDKYCLTTKGGNVYAEPAVSTVQHRLGYKMVLLDDTQYDPQRIVEWGSWLLQGKGM